MAPAPREYAPTEIVRIMRGRFFRVGLSSGGIFYWVECAHLDQTDGAVYIEPLQTRAAFPALFFSAFGGRIKSYKFISAAAFGWSAAGQTMSPATHARLRRGAWHHTATDDTRVTATFSHSEAADCELCFQCVRPSVRIRALVRS